MTETKVVDLSLESSTVFTISTASQVNSKKWTQKKTTWASLMEQLKSPVTTSETVQEYKEMTKEEKTRKKDVGGFVGGICEGGSRRKEDVNTRTLLTLDMDGVNRSSEAVVSDWELFYDTNIIIYSTHSHTPEKPRLRLIIPTSRAMSPEEYEAVGRAVAASLDIEQFDDTTYEANRLMFYPSVSKDGVYFYHATSEQGFLDVDSVLESYGVGEVWKDPLFWPRSSRDETRLHKAIAKQQDPLEKQGIIGAFCRAYHPIQVAIETFLSDVYEPTSSPTTFTYVKGSTYGGLRIFANDSIAHSFHSTDPAVDKASNAFDLVRIHRFGHLDEDAGKGVFGKHLPSFRAMREFAQDDDLVKQQIAEDKFFQVSEEFDYTDELSGTEDELSTGEAQAGTDTDKPGVDPKRAWIAKLTLNNKGEFEKSLENAVLIMANDPHLKEIKFNEFTGRINVTGPLPWAREGVGGTWRDVDDSHLHVYLATKRGIEFPHRTVQTALEAVADKRRFHPVRDYLEALAPWDGVPRVEEVFIDCLGASDTPYVRAATRVTFIGAVARAMSDGEIKMDTMLVLIGAQGQKKSTLIRRLAVASEWFLDDFSLSEIRDKTAAEKIQGKWITEVAEMNGMNKAEVDTLKNFISRAKDTYRASFGHHALDRRRQGIFIGTTNARDGFLRDTTGNRRYYPILTNKKYEGDIFKDITDEYLNQFWAEALHYYKQGEDWYIKDESLMVAAKQAQEEQVEVDDRVADLRDYLDIPLPERGVWNEWSIEAREDYIREVRGNTRPENLYTDDEGVAIEFNEIRETITRKEIWCEFFGRVDRDMKRGDQFEISQLMDKVPGWQRYEKNIRAPKGYTQTKGWVRIGSSYDE